MPNYAPADALAADLAAAGLPAKVRWESTIYVDVPGLPGRWSSFPTATVKVRPSGSIAAPGWSIESQVSCTSFRGETRAADLVAHLVALAR